MTHFFMQPLFLMFICLSTRIISSLCTKDNLSNYDQVGFWEQCRTSFSSQKKPIIYLHSVKEPRRPSALVIHPDERPQGINISKNFNCTFSVKARYGEKLFATVQSMTFESTNYHSCIDSIKFKTKENNVVKGPYCGKLENTIQHGPWNNYSLNFHNFQDPTNFSNRDNLGIYSTDGEIIVTIFMSQKNLHRKLEDNLLIFFTVYDDDCDEQLNDKHLGKFASSVDGVCMKKTYICDGIQNCDDAICGDEKNCGVFNENIVIRTKTAINFYYICIVGISFILLLFFCLYEDKELSSETETPQSSASNGPFQNQADREISVIISLDSPPSYDALFVCEPPPSYDSLSFY